MKEPDRLTVAIYNAFSSQGQPMHYTQAALVAYNELGTALGGEDTPKLVKKVYRKIRSNPELFERVSPGIYRVKVQAPEQTYEEVPVAQEPDP